MGTQGEDLAAGLAAARAEVEDFVRGCDDSTWDAGGTAEGWPVRVVAMHCAEGNRLLLGWLEEMLSGQGVRMSAADVDARNAENARRWATCTREEVLAEMASAEPCITALRALADADLDRTAPFGPGGGAEFRVSLLAGAAERHLRSHLASMRGAAAARAATAG